MSQLDAQTIAQIVRDAGGRVTGRTRLQKLTYLLFVAGLADGLQFVYKHYGPYSDQLAEAARDAALRGYITETEQRTAWGGFYYDYVSSAQVHCSNNAARSQLASLAAAADPTELELAATAIFLSKAGFERAWAETARRKPDKAHSGRLERAQALLKRLSEVQTPVPLPLPID